MSGVMGISAGGAPLSMMLPMMSAARAAGARASIAINSRTGEYFMFFIFRELNKADAVYHPP
jgi:hypothetical protein